MIAVMESAALLIFTSTPKELHRVLPGVIEVFGFVLPKMKLTVFGLLLAVILATYAALTRTWIGRAAYAYAQNPEAAALMGVRTSRLQTGVVVYSTALAGLGGALYASLYSLEPTLGSLFVLKAVEAAILAGIGSVIGSLLGGVILGVTEGIGSIYLPLAFRDAYGLVFLVAILLFKPAGLFAGRK
jgi:branched-chain amino acid transport system permease protein